MAHRLSPQAQADVDNLAYYLFVETGSIATADRIIESLTARFSLLGSHPRAGRRRSKGTVERGTVSIAERVGFGPTPQHYAKLDARIANGTRLILTPVASNTAFATAASIGFTTVSPAP